MCWRESSSSEFFGTGGTVVKLTKRQLKVFPLRCVTRTFYWDVMNVFYRMARIHSGEFTCCILEKLWMYATPRRNLSMSVSKLRRNEAIIRKDWVGSTEYTTESLVLPPNHVELLSWVVVNLKMIRASPDDIGVS